MCIEKKDKEDNGFQLYCTANYSEDKQVFLGLDKPVALNTAKAV